MDAHTANTIKGRAPLRASQSLRTALRKRGKSVGSITYLYSSKNNRDIVLASDLEFAHAVLLEADEAVASYDVDPDRIIALIEEHGYVASKPDAVVRYHSGRVELVEVKYFGQTSEERALMQKAAQSAAASSIGASWSWFTERDFEHCQRLVHDWLHILPVLAQTRPEAAAVWKSLSSDVERAIPPEGTTLAKLCALELDSWNLVFTIIFLMVQQGKLGTDLSGQPLSAKTMIRRAT